jgi:hypothetical protein
MSAGEGVADHRLNLRLVEYLCQTRSGKLGRHRATAHKAKKWSEVSSGRETRYEQAPKARLKVLVQNRESVGEL